MSCNHNGHYQFMFMDQVSFASIRFNFDEEFKRSVRDQAMKLALRQLVAEASRIHVQTSAPPERVGPARVAGMDIRRFIPRRP